MKVTVWCVGWVGLMLTEMLCVMVCYLRHRIHFLVQDSVHEHGKKVSQPDKVKHKKTQPSALADHGARVLLGRMPPPPPLPQAAACAALLPAATVHITEHSCCWVAPPCPTLPATTAAAAAQQQPADPLAAAAMVRSSLLLQPMPVAA